MTLFEADSNIGGQFNLARQIPGKQEFTETLRYYHRILVFTHVLVRLNTKATIDDLKTFDTVILASGITPRTPEVPGIDHPSVVSYLQVLRDKVPAGKRVAIIGAGGIGVDVAHYLSGPPPRKPISIPNGVSIVLSINGAAYYRSPPEHPLAQCISMKSCCCNARQENWVSILAKQNHRMDTPGATTAPRSELYGRRAISAH